MSFIVHKDMTITSKFQLLYYINFILVVTVWKMETNYLSHTELYMKPLAYYCYSLRLNNKMLYDF